MPPDPQQGFQFVNLDPASFQAFSTELQELLAKYGVELLAEARIAVKRRVPIPPASPGVVSPLKPEDFGPTNNNGDQSSTT